MGDWRGLGTYVLDYSTYWMMSVILVQSCDFDTEGYTEPAYILTPSYMFHVYTWNISIMDPRTQLYLKFLNLFSTFFFPLKFHPFILPHAFTLLFSKRNLLIISITVYLQTLRKNYRYFNWGVTSKAELINNVLSNVWFERSCLGSKLQDSNFKYNYACIILKI
jgi:hypothetical protein